MKQIIVKDLVKNQTDLEQFDVKKQLIQLLEVPEEYLFPVSDELEVEVELSLKLRNRSDDGVISRF